MTKNSTTGAGVGSLHTEKVARLRRARPAVVAV